LFVADLMLKVFKIVEKAEVNMELKNLRNN